MRKRERTIVDCCCFLPIILVAVSPRLSIADQTEMGSKDELMEALKKEAVDLESKILKFLGFMWNLLSWVMEAAAIMAIALANGG
ncbi:unnamed protein product [Camellia sinensis]